MICFKSSLFVEVSKYLPGKQPPFSHMECKFGELVPCHSCKLSSVLQYWCLDHEIWSCLFCWTWKCYRIVHPVYVMMVKFWKIYLEPETPGTAYFPMWMFLSQLYLSRVYWEGYRVLPNFVRCLALQCFRDEELVIFLWKVSLSCSVFFLRVTIKYPPTSPFSCFLPSLTPVCFSFK